MITALSTLLGAFVLVNLFGYATHKSLHQSWTGRLNKAHMTHHLRLYPPTDFFSDEYRNPGRDNTVIIFGIASIPLLALPVVIHFLGWMSSPLMFVTLGEMLLLGFLHDYLHDAFHITNHWLNRYSIFKKWVKLHIYHHVNMQANFGIFTFFLDKLFGTFSNGNQNN